MAKAEFKSKGLVAVVGDKKIKYWCNVKSAVSVKYIVFVPLHVNKKMLLNCPFQPEMSKLSFSKSL